MKSLLLLPFLLATCSPTGVSREAGRTERAAQDRIMLVRNSPETLGHRRLVYQSATHPDLNVFLKDEGLPDFIAETSSDDRQYLVLYYLDARQGWMCRTHRLPNARVHFAGPYSMTKRETAVLRELQSNSGEQIPAAAPEKARVN